MKPAWQSAEGYQQTKYLLSEGRHWVVGLGVAVLCVGWVSVTLKARMQRI